jgi:hypothetical protein
MKMDLPPLAQFKPRSEYRPQYGDYFVWSGWFSTWHGVVINYDQAEDEISVIFSGVPFLLFTMDEAAQKKDTKKLKLDKVRKAGNGKFAIQRHDEAQNARIWYI